MQLVLQEKSGQAVFPGKTVVALGMFDGVHSAHRALLSEVRERAESLHAFSGVVTFYNHPVEVLHPEKPVKQLMTPRQKISALRRAGVARLWMMRFTPELAALSAEAFFTHICTSCNACGLVVGYNYRFGAQAKGDASLLRQLAAPRGIEVSVIGEVDYEGAPVSSTRIRQCVAQGDVEGAAAMLCEPYCLSGCVVDGRQIGRKMGMPTANIRYAARSVLPREGVYITTVRWRGAWYAAVTNVGTNPTVGGRAVTVETHVLDVNESFYGEMLHVSFRCRLRGEMCFTSLDALRAQLKKDVLAARTYFAHQSGKNAGK